MRKSAERRKAEIVIVVLALADRIGPDRVTTGAVATAIGVTQAALFRHFPTKAALWQAVAEHARTQPGIAQPAGAGGIQYSTKRHGTTLGLALAREIAEPHGGRTALLHRDGGGLCVWMVLPA